MTLATLRPNDLCDCCALILPLILDKRRFFCKCYSGGAGKLLHASVYASFPWLFELKCTHKTIVMTRAIRGD